MVAELKAMVKLTPRAKSAGSSSAPMSLKDMERQLGLNSLDDTAEAAEEEEERDLEQLAGADQEQAGGTALSAAQQAWEAWADAVDAWEDKGVVKVASDDFEEEAAEHEPEHAVRGDVVVPLDAVRAKKPRPQACTD